MAELLDSKAGERFKELHPDYYGCERNSSLLRGWIVARGGCVSLRNLEYAFHALKDSLEKRPSEPVESVRKTNNGSDRGVIRVADVRVVRDPVTPEDRAIFADKPFESDVTRKKRDEQLRRVATADRIARRNKGT